MSQYGEGVRRPTVVCGPSRTKQSFRDQVNINSIISKYNKTGMITHLNRSTPFYGDVSGISSYQESLEVVRNAETLFMGMSAEVRGRFGNDPAQMIAFLQDPKNIDEAVKLGMATKKEVPVEKIQKVQMVDDDGKPVRASRSSKKGDDAE